MGRIAERKGAALLVVATLAEAFELKNAGLNSDILILGERHTREIEACGKNGFRICAGSFESLELLNRAAAATGALCQIHLKIDSGMSRYGFRWSDTAPLVAKTGSLKNIQIEGVLSHFAMSDELDKTFANLQLQRFTDAVEQDRADSELRGSRRLCRRLRLHLHVNPLVRRCRRRPVGRVALTRKRRPPVAAPFRVVVPVCRAGTERATTSRCA